MQDITTPPKTDRVRARRMHERGKYDKQSLYDVIDAGFLCHVGYVIDGAPFVTPTLYWREGNYIYWHGSAASRMLESVEGRPVCITISHFDGFVMARSAFNHSVNYRSVMLLGNAELVAEPDEKAESLKHFLDSLFPGRWDMMRPMTAQELKATSVLRMEIDEASAKSRSGPPGDQEDAGVPVWAGVLPMSLMSGVPQRDVLVPEGVTAPEHVTGFDASRPYKGSAD
ncbi:MULTISPECIES: pyridoxamine 5'-phosphate oxidase family protein [Sphingobium]|uniref:pyridoxamine 5'-phosphate oxidase family protein n=1 Tax=Sphingobium TaxID=165695 RepID=UPI00159C6FD9|nr:MULTISPECIES: pyridoxamine 5'-phosphate oxidase family protein [unclassified Sphingobium]